MAIQQCFTTNFGLECQEAYHRVTSFSVDMLSKRAEIGLATYINKEARNNGAQPVSIRGYIVRNEEKPQVESDIVVSLNVSEVNLANATTSEEEAPATTEPVAEGETTSTETSTEPTTEPAPEEATQEPAVLRPIEFKLDFNGDGIADITLTEGADFGLQDVVEKVPHEIATSLNGNPAFNANFVAEVPYQNALRIKALPSGGFGGSKGNGLVASGQIVLGQHPNALGSDYVQGDYDKYFSTQDFEENSIVVQCYSHIKRLSEFSDALDV